MGGWGRGLGRGRRRWVAGNRDGRWEAVWTARRCPADQGSVEEGPLAWLKEWALHCPGAVCAPELRKLRQMQRWGYRPGVGASVAGGGQALPRCRGQQSTAVPRTQRSGGAGGVSDIGPSRSMARRVCGGAVDLAAALAGGGTVCGAIGLGPVHALQWAGRGEGRGSH